MGLGPWKTCTVVETQLTVVDDLPAHTHAEDPPATSCTAPELSRLSQCAAPNCYILEMAMPDCSKFCRQHILTTNAKEVILCCQVTEYKSRNGTQLAMELLFSQVPKGRQPPQLRRQSNVTKTRNAGPKKIAEETLSFSSLGSKSKKRSINCLEKRDLATRRRLVGDILTPPQPCRTC